MCVSKIKRHTLAVRQSILMIENTKILLEYNNLSVNEIFNSLSLTDNYNLLSFISNIKMKIGMGIDYDEAYKSAVENIVLTADYDSQDRGYMKGFLSMLGKSDISGQIVNCELYKEFFRKKLEILENEENNRCKTAAVCSLGVGVIIIILLI